MFADVANTLREEDMNTKMLEQANRLIRNYYAAAFGVIDESGRPSVSAIGLCDPENILELHFTTTLDSNKVKRLEKNNNASMCCFDDDNNITLVGTTEIIVDQETKSKYWQEWMSKEVPLYPDGETDPNYCIVKFTTKRVSLWLVDEGAEFTLDWC